MKTEHQYIEDLSEIRRMMERSTKFLSLSGLAGILAGVYGLAGSIIAFIYLSGWELELLYSNGYHSNIWMLIILGLIVLVLAVGTAVYLSARKASKNNELLWNPVAKRLVFNMAIPLLTGGMLILILILQGVVGLIAPVSLIFYGLALLNASKFTFSELRSLGIIEIIIGLISAWFINFGLIFWGIGFGVMHIAYGIYMHLKYEK